MRSVRAIDVEAYSLSGRGGVECRKKLKPTHLVYIWYIKLPLFHGNKQIVVKLSVKFRQPDTRRDLMTDI